MMSKMHMSIVFHKAALIQTQGNEKSKPAIGKANQLEKVEEMKFETIFPAYLENKIMSALLAAHPYEEVAYDIISLENKNQQVGSGLIGELKILPVKIMATRQSSATPHGDS